MPKGGVARRATVIEEERKLTPHVLLLDAGNTLTGQQLANSTKGKVLIEAMNRLGYTAMAIGERELQLGLEELAARRREARFPLLSANVVVASSGELLSSPYTIVEMGGLRLAILGLTNSDAATIANMADKVKVTDPLEAARKYIPEMAAQAEMVIVLSHIGVDLDQRLADQIPGISLIVGGATRSVISPPLVVKDTLIVQAGYDGEWLGRLRLEVDEKGKIVWHQGEALVLGPEYQDHPDMARWLAEVKKASP